MSAPRWPGCGVRSTCAVCPPRRWAGQPGDMLVRPPGCGAVRLRHGPGGGGGGDWGLWGQMQEGPERGGCLGEGQDVLAPGGGLPARALHQRARQRVVRGVRALQGVRQAMRTHEVTCRGVWNASPPHIRSWSSLASPSRSVARRRRCRPRNWMNTDTPSRPQSSAASRVTGQQRKGGAWGSRMGACALWRATRVSASCAAARTSSSATCGVTVRSRHCFRKSLTAHMESRRGTCTWRRSRCGRASKEAAFSRLSSLTCRHVRPRCWRARSFPQSTSGCRRWALTAACTTTITTTCSLSSQA